MCSANHGCLAVNLQQHMSLFLRAGGVRSNNVAPAHVLYVYIFSNRDKTAYTMLQCLEIPHILVLELVYCCWSESAGKAAFAACQYNWISHIHRRLADKQVGGPTRVSRPLDGLEENALSCCAALQTPCSIYS